MNNECSVISDVLILQVDLCHPFRTLQNVLTFFIFTAYTASCCFTQLVYWYMAVLRLDY